MKNSFKYIFLLICSMMSFYCKAIGDCPTIVSFSTGWYVSVEAQGCTDTICDLLPADSLLLIKKVKAAKRQCDKIAADSCISKTCTDATTTCVAKHVAAPEIGLNECIFYTDSLGNLKYRCAKTIYGTYECVCRLVPRPQVTPSQPPTTLCGNNPITLTAFYAPTAEYYQWFMNDTVIDDAENLTYVVTLPGTYTFTVMDADGSIVTSVPIVISCNSNQIPALSNWALILFGLLLLIIIYFAIGKLR